MAQTAVTTELVELADCRPASEREWDALQAGCGHATYFHSRGWAEVWRSASGGRIRPRPLHLSFSDGRTAVLPLSERRTLGGLVRATLSSPAGTYGGWISGDELGSEHAAILTELLLRRSTRLTWRTNPFAGDPPADRRAQEDPTQVVELSDDFESVRRRWTKGHRAAAKQAAREGVTVRLAASEDDWRAYFRIYQDSLRRWGDEASASYGWELFDALKSRPTGEVRLWLADHEGRPVAGALCLYAPRHLSYWHGAALESHFPLRPVHLLMHEAMRDACERGLSWFDFNPSGGHEGVRAFKKGFGCESRPSFVISVRPAWARWAGRLRGRA